MTPAEAAALDDEQPLTTDDERQAAEVQVLHPETHSDGRGTIRIGEFEMDLRPINVKYERMLAAIVNPIFSTFQKELTKGDVDFAALAAFQDGFTGCLHELCKMYGKPIGKEYIEEQLGSDEIREILERQLRLSRRNLFLLVNLRNLLTTASQSVLQTNRIADEANALVTQQLALPTRASAKAGASPSTPSSADTPPGS